MLFLHPVSPVLCSFCTLFLTVLTPFGQVYASHIGEIGGAGCPATRSGAWEGYHLSARFSSFSARFEQKGWVKGAGDRGAERAERCKTGRNRENNCQKWPHLGLFYLRSATRSGVWHVIRSTPIRAPHLSTLDEKRDSGGQERGVEQWEQRESAGITDKTVRN